MDLRWQTLCFISVDSKAGLLSAPPQNCGVHSWSRVSANADRRGWPQALQTHHHRQTRLTTERGQIPLPYGGLHMAFTCRRVYSDAVLPATREGLNRKPPWQMRTQMLCVFQMYQFPWISSPCECICCTGRGAGWIMATFQKLIFFWLE